jgi:1-acyl-sn-glycerol-3-phosphate acyltransferase
MQAAGFICGGQKCGSMLARKIYRLMLLMPATLFFLFAGGCVNLCLAGSARRRARADAVCTMLWSRAMCRILGIRVMKSGADRAISSFAVCNHVSYIDVIVMGSVRPLSFLAMHEVKGWPIMGWLASLGGTIFINRKSKKAAVVAIRDMECKQDYGVMVVVFPEGTTSDGKSTKAFKSTLFSVPARRNIPVTPVSVRYSADRLGIVAWYGGMKLAPHFWNLLGIKSIDAVLHFNQPVSSPAEEISAVEARKRLCTLAYESVATGCFVQK